MLGTVDLELDAPARTGLGLEAKREFRELAGLRARGADPLEHAAEPRQRRTERTRLSLDEVEVLRVPRCGARSRPLQYRRIFTKSRSGMRAGLSLMLESVRG